ncbi:MAG TPA: hypothetical protein VIG49_03790, partial [Acetobacteraceae bacterium]
LLGIASVAALLGRIPATNQPGGGGQPGGAIIAAPAEVAQPRVPRWSDLVVADVVSREIDVTRVQMLIFTLISAAFVTLKVVVSYEIPTIPDTFLLLMGISNGVYVTGRHIPSGQKGAAGGG